MSLSGLTESLTSVTISGSGFVQTTISYSGIHEVVEFIVNSRINKYIIPYMSKSDVAQEIRQKCFTMMDKFNQEKIGDNPYSFFIKGVDNHLYNLCRGIWTPNNPPCIRCEYWNKKNKMCIIDEKDCTKILKYREKMKTKSYIKGPTLQSRNEEKYNFSLSENRLETPEIEAYELDEHIRYILPDNLIMFYEKMLSGEKVSSDIKNKIRKIIAKMIKDDFQ